MWPFTLSLSSIFLNSITAGSIFTFPLWQPYLTNLFNLSQAQTNTVALSAIVGQYVTAAGWGHVVDRRGPAVVSALGGLTFFIGYGLMALLCVHPPVSSTLSTLLLASFYFLVGSATGCSYFSAIITLTTSMPPSHAGLAVGVPCAIFGLSPVLLSNVAVRFFMGNEGEVDAKRWLAFCSVFLGLINGLGGLLLKVIKVGDHGDHGDHNDHEEEGHSEIERYQDSSQDSGFASEIEPLLPKKKKIVQKETTLLEFFKSPTTIILGAILLLAAGPGEMVMSTLGSIIASLLSSTPAHRHPLFTPLSSTHVQLLSISNTFSRILSGYLSDHFSSSISRSTWLVISTLLLALSYTFSALFLTRPSQLYILSVGTGIGYGTVFTMVPSIIRTYYSPTQFGRNWGLVANFSAVGATLFMELYGVWADEVARKRGESTCTGTACFQGTLFVAAICCTVAFTLGGVLGRSLRNSSATTTRKS